MVGIATAFYQLFLKPHPNCSDGIKNQDEIGVDCGGSCKSCETAALSIIVGDKSYFSVSRLGKTTFYLELKNPSGDFWVKNFDYALNVYDALGNKLTSFSGSSSIAPSGKRVIVFAAADVDAKDVARTDLGIMNPEWSPLVEYHVEGVTASDVTSRVISGGRVYVSGNVTNNVASYAKKVNISAVFRDKESRIVNASMTTVDSLQSFSKKPFEIFLTPDQANIIDLTRTEILIEAIR